MTDIQLSVRDLQKTFHPGLFEASVEVLKGLSFEVARGEIFGFLGPPGKQPRSKRLPRASTRIRAKFRSAVCHTPRSRPRGGSGSCPKAHTYTAI